MKSTHPQRIYVSKSNGATFAGKDKGGIDFNSPVITWDKSRYRKMDIKHTLYDIYELIETKP